MNSLRTFSEESSKDCLLISNSQGAQVVNSALFHAEENITNRVTSISIAPADFVPKKFCNKAYNYRSNDPIPMLMPIYRTIFMKDSPKANVFYLEPKPNESQFFNHNFESPTYKRVIENSLNFYIKNYQHQQDAPD